MAKYSSVIGTGGYLPETVQTNDEISTTVDTSDSWIVERTGIKSRRIAAPHESAASMAEIAARQALETAGIAPEEIDDHRHHRHTGSGVPQHRLPIANSPRD